MRKIIAVFLAVMLVAVYFLWPRQHVFATVTFSTYDATPNDIAASDVDLDGVHDGSIINAKLAEYANYKAVKFEFLGHYVRPDVPIVIQRGGVTIAGINPGGRDPTPETGTIIWPQGSFPSITVDGGPIPGSISNILLTTFGTKAGTYGVVFKGGVVDSYVSMLKIEDAYYASIALLWSGTIPGTAPQWIYIDRSNLTGGIDAALLLDVGVGEVQLQQSGLYSSGGPAILNRGATLIATNNFMNYTRNHFVRHENGTTIITASWMSPGNIPAGVYDAVNVAGGGYVLVDSSIMHGANLMRWGVHVEPGATATVRTGDNIYRTFLSGNEDIPLGQRN